MLRLAAVIYVLVATVLAGSAVTAMLALKLSEGWQIAAAFAVGLVVAAPVALLLGRKIYTAIAAPAAGSTIRHA
ncbi:hypothetical protein NOF55_15580 [Rhizobiaceae bacterium BDR2-2]|uniref:CTP synthetase n=1 Tax=Ectorhizobium quercum TaxID=2965071 RepID=A0AAE3N238_9HYPH|nr:hypothetical protein [Ectorhizobium quercum]MCX8998536.1 hypothetical protein [Ectorhizobium quercum]